MDREDPTGEISWEDLRSDIADLLDDLGELPPDLGGPELGAAGDLIRGAEEARGVSQGSEAAVDLVDRVPEVAPEGTEAVSKATAPYKRPSGATTAAQRASVQGKPCVKCGDIAETQVAGHREALVKEYHQTGSIDKAKMRSVDAVQPECPTCSAKEGAEMSRYSRKMNKSIDQRPMGVVRICIGGMNGMKDCD